MYRTSRRLSLPLLVTLLLFAPAPRLQQLLSDFASWWAADAPHVVTKEGSSLSNGG